ncbi:hypothetical protein FRC12_006883 [Ceratobasidium sp. 428]|nr:hypothetical protein FRC12_006883 [Ceratobasidium sp. 428]
MAGKRKCPCCDEDDSESQIRRHLKIQRERITRELASRFNDNEGDDGGGYGNDKCGNDAIFGGADEGDGGMDLGDAGMEVSDDDPLPDRPHGAVEDYAPVRGTVQNPPVIYEEWHEPPVDEADDSEDEGEDEDNIERDPAYVEHDVPLGLNPLDEPGPPDEDIQRMLELDFEDSAAEEWHGMYARYISRRAWTPKKTLPSLSKPRVNWKYEHGVQASSREVTYPEFPTVVLGTPIRRVPLEQPLTRHLTRCFGHFSPEQNTAQLTECIEADSIIRYGRLRLAGDGDRIRTAALVDNDPIARDNSFVKAHDNASDVTGTDDPYLEPRYARLLDIYHVWFNKVDGTPERFLLGHIQVCEAGGLNVALPENPYVTFNIDNMTRLSSQIINLLTVVAAVGRAHIAGPEWAIVDRSLLTTKETSSLRSNLRSSIHLS